MAYTSITKDMSTYKVTKGDTFSHIAQQCIALSTQADTKFGVYKGLNLYNAGIDKLKSFNPDIENTDLIYVGQTIILNGTAAKKTTTAAQRPKITAFGLKSSSADTDDISQTEVYATWSWDRKNTDHYQVRWKYGTGDGVGWVHTDTKTEANGAEHNTSSRYSKISGIDGNATHVTFQVKPISKTYKKNDKETHYWTADWSTKQTYWFKNNPPLIPNVIPTKVESGSDSTTSSIKITPAKTTKTSVSYPEVTITLKGLTETKGEGQQPVLNAHEVQFQLLKNGKTVYKNGRAVIDTTTREVSYTCKITAGDVFRVRTRSYRGAISGDSYSKTQGVYSDWTAYSEEFGTAPTVVSKIDTLYLRVKTSEKYVVRAGWDRMADDDNEYIVGYTLDPEYFTTNEPAIQLKEVGTQNVTDIEITDANYIGKTLYFALKAKTDLLGETPWSEYTELILGSKPSVPTTWSSSSTAMLDDQVSLYWVHQSTDGSPESWARLEVAVTIGKDKTSLKGVLTADENGNYILDSYEPNNNSNKYLEIQKIKDNYGQVVNSTSSVSLTFPSDSPYFEEGAELEWRVSTAGIYEDDDDLVYSDWSPWRKIEIYAEPTISLTATSADGNLTENALTSFPIYVEMESDVNENFQKPISYYLEVISMNDYETIDSIGNVKMVKTGEKIYSQHFDTNDKTVNTELSAGNIDLENGQNYIIKCTSSFDSGLTAEAETELTVEWTDDECWPNLEITYDEETYTTMLKPFCMDVDEITGTEYIAQGVTLSVYRREFDGSFTELATGLDNEVGTYVTDPHPSLDYARYRVVAIKNDTGAVSYYDVPGFPIGETSIIIQWDEQWSEYDVNDEFEPEGYAWAGSLLKLPYNVDISENHDPDVELIEYIGRENPVSYHGTQIGHTSTWYTVIPRDDVETLYAIRRLSRWMGVVYVREPSGTGYWANVKISYTRKHNDLTIPVTLTVTRVEGE